MKRLSSKDFLFISGGLRVQGSGGGGGFGPAISGSGISVAGYVGDKKASGEKITTEGVVSAAATGAIGGRFGSMAHKSGPAAEIALSGMSAYAGSKIGSFVDKKNKEHKEHKDNSSRVICTHFYQKGILSRELWRADMEYTLKYLPQIMVNGYHLWAIPYVKLMRKSPFAERVMYPIAYYRAKEIAYKMGYSDKGSLRGKIIRSILEPICFTLGLFTTKKKYQELWRSA